MRERKRESLMRYHLGRQKVQRYRAYAGLFLTALIFIGCADEEDIPLANDCLEVVGIYALESYQEGMGCLVDGEELLGSARVEVSHALVSCEVLDGVPFIEVQSCDDLESCLRKETAFEEGDAPPEDLKSGAFAFTHDAPSWESGVDCSEVIYEEAVVSVTDGALLIERERWRLMDIPELMGEAGSDCDQDALAQRASETDCEELLRISGRLLPPSEERSE